MATKSILKTVYIKERKSVNALVNALENAKGKSAQKVTYQRMPSEASRDEIRAMFGAKNDGLQDR